MCIILGSHTVEINIIGIVIIIVIFIIVMEQYTHLLNCNICCPGLCERNKQTKSLMYVGLNDKTKTKNMQKKEGI